MSSFCRMSSCWWSLLFRMTSSQRSHLLIPKRPLKTAAPIEVTNYGHIFSSTNSSFKPCQEQILHSGITVKKSKRFLQVTPTFLSFASDRNLNVSSQKKKKFGALKTRAKRTDWCEGEKLIELTILKKGVRGWTHEDWTELSERLQEIMTGSWEILCIIFLYNTSNLTLGKSLMEYVMSRSEEPSSIFLTYCVGLLGHTCDGDAEQEKLMKKYYDNLMSTTDILDTLKMEVLCKGLSYTSYYKECETLMSKAKETNSLSVALLVNTFIGGVRNHDHLLCSDVLRHFDDADSSAAFVQQFALIVEAALKHKNREGLRQFFSFANKMGLSPPQHIVENAMDCFRRYEPDQWHGRFGNIDHISGRCSVCRQAMEELSISDDDFKAVQSAFLDQVIVSENIFYKSTPDEVRSFTSFVAKNGPFDVVIDGLNVLYLDRSGNHNNKPDPYMLSLLVSSITEHGLKVLILGSKRFVSQLPRSNIKCSAYGTSTTKADDAFFLYAALRSGKNTLIVSADKLRDHKFRLEPKLRPIFHRWLKLVQVFDIYLQSHTDSLILKRQKFDVGPVEDNGGWHLPFDDTHAGQPFGKNGVLCLRQRTSAENVTIGERHNHIGSSRSKFPNPR